jgi:hypothetical protein
MGPVCNPRFASSALLHKTSARAARRSLEETMQDLAYIGLTVLVFAVLYLIVKGVEHFER